MTDHAGGINTRSITVASAILIICLGAKIVIAPLTIPRYLPVVSFSGFFAGAAVLLLVFGIFSRDENIKKLQIVSLVITSGILAYLIVEAVFFYPDYYAPNRLLSYSYLCSFLTAVIVLGFAAFTFPLYLSVMYLLAAIAYVLTVSQLKFQKVDLLLIPILLLVFCFTSIILYLIRILYLKLNSERRLSRDLSAAREKIINQEKMTTLATFAAGTAHEINNPVTHMYGNIEYLEKHLHNLLHFAKGGNGSEPSQRLAETANDIETILKDYRRGFDRVIEIVHNMKRVFRQKSRHTDRIDLAGVVGSSIDYFKKELASPVIFETLFNGPLFLRCSAGDFLTVFQTIISNSIDAINKETGCIKIEGIKKGDEIVVSVYDNGCGMCEEVQSEIFKPFFSTKSSTDHMGIGLALCKSIVEQYGGRIKVESREGEYTVVEVRVPVNWDRS